MSDKAEKEGLYSVLKDPRHAFDKDEVKALFGRSDQGRVDDLAARLKTDLSINLPKIYLLILESHPAMRRR